MASAIAGPSSASAGPPPDTSMNTLIPAHPAFPSLIPRNLIPQPSFNPLKDKRPSTTEQLIGFIGTHGRGNQAIVDNVIPTLLVMTGHKIPGQVGRDAEEDRKMWGFGGDDGGGKGADAGGKGGEGSGGAGGKGGAKGKGKEVDERVRQAERVIAALPAHNPGDDELARSAAIYLFILTARLELEDTQMNHISTIDFATRLIAVGDVDQLRACGPRLATFAWDLLEVGKCIRQQALALNAIHMLLNKCYGPGQLSGAHAAFLHGCLAARQYDMARPFLTGVYIDIKQSQPSYRDIITFFHHAGLICASLKEWELAVEHFSVCVSVPTVAASAIQLAAAKRAYLCGLLHNGKLPHFPKYISLALSRPFERHLSTYLELGKMYMGANWAKVIEIAGNKLFREDTNFGLVEQVVASIPAQRVMIVSETISRLMLGDLMQRLGAQGEEDEQAVLDLLDTLNATGKLSTRITDNATSSARIITFLPDSHTQNFDSPEALLRLKGMTRLSDFLDQEMRRASREAGIGEAYLKKQMHQLESKGRGDTSGPGTGLDMGMMGLEGEGRKVRGVGGNMGDMGF